MRFDLAAGLPAAHHQEAAPALGHRRAALVPLRRDQRQLAARARRDDLGRVGRRRRRARPGLRLPVAVLADPGRRPHRPDGPGDRGHPDQSRTPGGTSSAPGTWPSWTRWRCRRATPCSSSTSPEGDQRAAVLPALPAHRRRLPGRAVQHRLLRAAHPHGRPGQRAAAGRFRAHPRRRPPLPEPPGQARLQLTREPRPLPTLGLNPGSPRSTTSPSRTSRLDATTRIRASRPRSRSDGVRLRPDLVSPPWPATGSSGATTTCPGSFRPTCGASSSSPWAMLIMGRKTFESIGRPLPGRTT